jgi:hypothetical protein
MYSGALPPATAREIVAWHQTRQGSGVNGSRLKLGALSGAGNNIANGNAFETFTTHGWGFGLLHADLAEHFLVQYYALSAHAYTRGTWIAPESAPLDRTVSAPPFCTPAGLTVALYLKWMLVFEDPDTHVLWLGKALPREWLSEGEALAVDGATTAYGRVSLRVASAVLSRGTISANLTVPAAWKATGGAAAPPGGVRVRFRAPRGAAMRGATVNGATCAAHDCRAEGCCFNATDQSVFMPPLALGNTGAASLQQVVAAFSTARAPGAAA